ncbi:MAG: acetate--CoA ligase, partial [Cellvibrionales bacterium]|nr:acetate--CoA ligase [Cellvibrionales bacterium]
MSDMKIYPVHKNFKKQANLKLKAYKSMYLESIENSDIFWSEQAKEFLNWQKPWNQVSSYDFSTGQASWFSEGKLNASVNCIDRHLPTKANQAAIIWEGDNPEDSEIISYRKLSDHVNKLSNALRSRNVKKGDRVCIYMPMIPEVLYAMLACARIGAIHSVVFGGFSPEALKDRIIDSDCHVVVTADEGVRGGKRIPLKANADIAMSQCPLVHTCFVISHTKGKVDWVDKRDIWYHEAIKKETTYCLPENMDAEDPLFILYTSGSTGKPKGVLHTTAGYLLQAAMTHKYVFDHKDNDIYWCTADVGWVTGHSYIVYGPLCNGATTLMFEGVPTYPDASRFWQIIDKHKVSIFYTAPTAIRSLLAAGNDYVKRTSRKSLRLLGTVGEPINPEAWEWYYHVIGNSSCPIVDTWWQTETGAHMLTPLPGVHNMKPGCATAPFFGIEPALVNNAGNLID